MNKIVDIECSVEVYIDEYVDDISDGALFYEAISRLHSISKHDLKLKFTKLFIEQISVIELISIAKNLSIIDADKLEQFLKTFD